MNRQSKSCKLRILGILTVCFIAVLLFIHTERAMAVELYFDEEGNLMHVTKDTAISPYTCFRSVGWIIKRYDMPLDAKGQQYIVVPKRSDRSVIMEVDGTDIMYTYFKSTKNEILRAVEAVSLEWLKQLESYGGDVYIDTAMTVVENKVPKGGINSDGYRWGEVYLTYDGIAGARAWGGYDALKQYFGMCVEFPCLVDIPEEEILWSEKEYEYSSEPIYSLYLEAKESYNISEAIPSGSELKAKGKVSNYKYNVKSGFVTGVVKLPVKVSKTYILKWKDSEGNDKTQIRQIDRYYKVERDFSYYTCKDVKLWGLSQISLNNNCIVGGTYLKAISNAGNVSVTSYDDIMKHISINMDDAILALGPTVLVREDGLKPDIPYEDFSELANKAVKELSVRSDKITICGNDILKDDICSRNGKKPIYYEPPCSIIDFGDIRIREDARNEQHNGEYKIRYTLQKNHTGQGVVPYIDKNGVLNNIKVHTPVICEGTITSVSGTKDWQGNKLEEGNVTIGGEFKVDMSFSGFHSDYAGYGERDYSKYIRNIMIKMPFPVYYNNELRDENTWISVGRADDNGIVGGFKMPRDISHGEYEIEIKAYAINSMPGDMLGGKYSNAPTDGYFATNTIRVNVVRGYYDTPDSNKYKVVGTH